MFYHIDGIMRALAKKKTQWKEDWYFTEKVVSQKLSKYYAEVTLTTSLLLISAHLLNLFGKLRSSRTWDKELDNNPQDGTSYTTIYQKSNVKYVENE